MKDGDFIRVVLSCGIREEGIIFNSKYIDDDGVSWIILRHKDNINAELYIKKQYIAAHQIDNSILNDNDEIKTIHVEDLSVGKLNTIEEIVESKIEKAKLEREQFKKIMKSKNINNVKLNYSLPKNI